MKNGNEKNKRIELAIDMLFGVNHESKNYSDDGEVMDIDNYSKNGIYSVSADKYVKRSFEPDHPFLTGYGVGIEDKDGDDRLFSNHSAYMVSKPENILKDGVEYAFFRDLSIVWQKIVLHDLSKNRRVKMRGAKIAVERHYREIYLDKSGVYTKGLAGLNGDHQIRVEVSGRPLDSGYEHEQVMTAASMKEDLHRKGVFHIKITNIDTGKGLRLAVNGWEVIDLMKFRKSPRTSAGNKKPILHWVSEHLKGSNNAKVAEYKRGLQKFEADGFMLEISEPCKYLNEF